MTQQLKRFEKVILKNGVNGNTSAIVDTHWSLGGALLYTLTLLTTIGYGRLSPRTGLGKIIAMLYAMIGVPLMLILLSLLGSLLADATKKCYSKLRCRKEKTINSVVGYHRTPSSPQEKHLHKNHHDGND